ncbi:MAG: threonine/serine exporter family protein [Candidatus Velthaea sp.]
MNPQRDDTATDVLVALGRALHQAGTATDDLELALRDCAAALGAELQVDSLPTSLTLAVGPRNLQHTVILRLEPGKLDLRKLALLNDVTRGIRFGALEPAQAMVEIATIDATMKPAPAGLTILGYALLSCGAAVLLGGGAREIEVSSLIGLAIGSIAAIGDRVAAVERLFEVLGAFIATLVVAAFATYAGAIALYIAIIAGIIALLPGYTITTALHELASRHLIAGTARLGGALVTLLSLGCGFALAVAITGEGFFAAPILSPVHAPGGWVVPAAIAMAVALAIVLHARPVDLGWICASCVIAIAATRTFAGLPGHHVSAFAAAFIVGLLANLASRYFNIPQAVILVPGIIVLVPGSLSYESIIYVYQNNVTSALDVGVDAGLAAILIVAGTLLSQILVAPTRPRRYAL